MSNEDVYAAGLLSRARDPATQPPEIQAFLRAELDLLDDVIRDWREWYRRLGHTVPQETPEYLVTEGGFRSEHFSEARLRSLVGECTVRPRGDIACLVTF